MAFNKNFKTLLDEGQFTYEILASGITQLGKVNYAKKGIYFSSFTSLSTGLERIGKICLILDFYINNNGLFPDEKTLKKDIGHDLEKLYEKSKLILQTHNIKTKHLPDLDDNLHQEILSILSKFAKGDRYSNINYLVNNDYQGDTIYEWNMKVDNIIFQKRVSQKKKDKITSNAKIAGKLLGGVSSVLFISETREEITNIEKSSYLTGVAESVAKYRQLYVLQIIRYWVEILRSLQYKAMNVGNYDIPFFNEIFALFNNEDSYFLTRKTYERI